MASPSPITADGGLRKRSGSRGEGVAQLVGVLAVVPPHADDLAGALQPTHPPATLRDLPRKPRIVPSRGARAERGGPDARPLTDARARGRPVPAPGRAPRGVAAVPELPEVQALAESLDRRLRGRRIAGLTVASIAALKTYDPPVAALAGRAVAGVGRHGKFLDLEAAAAAGDTGLPPPGRPPEPGGLGALAGASLRHPPGPARAAGGPAPLRGRGRPRHHRAGHREAAGPPRGPRSRPRCPG